MLIIWISGCACVPPSGNNAPAEVKVRTFAEVYRQAKQGEKTGAGGLPALSLDAPLGAVKPYLPVILPPRVIKVWVPSHVVKEDKDIMVGGHWAFVMLEKTRWFIEGEIR